MVPSPRLAEEVFVLRDGQYIKVGYVTDVIYDRFEDFGVYRGFAVTCCATPDEIGRTALSQRLDRTHNGMGA